MTPYELSSEQQLRIAPSRRRRAAVILTLIGAAVVIALCLGIGVFVSGSGPAEKVPQASRADFTARLPDLPEIRPVSDPQALRRVSAEEAERLNAAIPLSTAPNPAARSLILPDAGSAGWMRALGCLTEAIYYEAGNEPDEGQRAVAQVILNRMRHPAFPNTVCGVVFQGSDRATGCQFTFTCDGSRLRQPAEAPWRRARRAALAAMAGHVFAPVGLSTHYHTVWVAPYWAPTLVKAQVIGAHIFYRWPGYWGTPPAFRQTYDANEPAIAPALPADSLIADAAPDGRPEGIAPIARPVLDLHGVRLPDTAGAEPVAPTDTPVTKTVGATRNRWIIAGPTRAE